MPHHRFHVSPAIRWGLILVCQWFGTLGHADEPEVVTPGAWAELLRATIVATVPEKTVKDKKWGGQAEVISRYDLKSKNGRLSLRPQTRRVNHGLWQRHTVTLLEPEKTLHIEFQEVTQSEDGTLRFTMGLQLRARVDVDFAHWVYGVKGLNGTTEADVTIAAIARCAVQLDTVFPEGSAFPAIQLIPEIEELRLNVWDIDARQIGLVGGWAADEIGNNSRSTVNSLLNEQTDQILKDLRRKIEKDKSKYQINPSWLNPRPAGKPASPKPPRKS